MKEQEQKEAIRLRVEERLGLAAIAEKLKVSKGTVSLWLRKFPLTEIELKERFSKNGRDGNKRKKFRGEKSKAFLVIEGKEISRQQKGEIAESAVLFRLALHGFNVFKSIFDGEKIDWLIEVPETGRLLKVQVKFVKESAKGLPILSLKKMNGHNSFRRYNENEVDFFVGYDLFTDTCYVWSFKEVSQNKGSITISDDAAEVWEKMRE